MYFCNYLLSRIRFSSNKNMISLIESVKNVRVACTKTVHIISLYYLEYKHLFLKPTYVLHDR